MRKLKVINVNLKQYNKIIDFVNDRFECYEIEPVSSAIAAVYDFDIYYYSNLSSNFFTDAEILRRYYGNNGYIEIYNDKYIYKFVVKGV